MIPATAYHLTLALEKAAMPTSPVSRCLRMLADLLREGHKPYDYQIDWLDQAADQLEETTMPKQPTPSRKGIPIGHFKIETDATGKTKVKPKPKRRPLPQQIAASKRKKWRAASEA